MGRMRSSQRGLEKKGKLRRERKEGRRETGRLTLLCNLMNAFQSPLLACRIGGKLAHRVPRGHRTWRRKKERNERKELAFGIRENVTMR